MLEPGVYKLWRPFLLSPPWDIPDWADPRLKFCCRFFESLTPKTAYVTFDVEGFADVDVTIQKFEEYWRVVERRVIYETTTFIVKMDSGEWVEPRIWNGAENVKRIEVAPFTPMKFLLYLPGFLLEYAIIRK